MKKVLISLTALIFSLTASAEVGDKTPITESQILEIKVEQSTTKSGKEKTEYIVIFTDNNGKKKMAYTTKTEYDKYNKSKQYKLDSDYYIVEMKTKLKFVVE